MENDEEKKNRRGKRLAGGRSWWTNGRVGKCTKKKQLHSKSFPSRQWNWLRDRRRFESGCFRNFFSRCCEAVGRAAGCLGLHGRRAQMVLSSTAISAAALLLQMRRREEKARNCSLVEAKSDLPCSRVWSVRRAKLRLNTAPPCCHDCNQIGVSNRRMRHSLSSNLCSTTACCI